MAYLFLPSESCKNGEHSTWLRDRRWKNFYKKLNVQNSRHDCHQQAFNTNRDGEFLVCYYIKSHIHYCREVINSLLSLSCVVILAVIGRFELLACHQQVMLPAASHLRSTFSNHLFNAFSNTSKNLWYLSATSKVLISSYSVQQLAITTDDGIANGIYVCSFNTFLIHFHRFWYDENVWIFAAIFLDKKADQLFWELGNGFRQLPVTDWNDKYVRLRGCVFSLKSGSWPINLTYRFFRSGWRKCRPTHRVAQHYHCNHTKLKRGQYKTPNEWEC